MMSAVSSRGAHLGHARIGVGAPPENVSLARMPVETIAEELA